MLQIYDLKTEYLHEPMGVDALQPRLSWKLKSDKKNVFRASYNIIARSGEKVIWDSKKVMSEQNLRVQYNGEALKSRQQGLF